MRKKDKTETNPGGKKDCANCGATGSGSYCSSCGQKYADIHRPFKEILADLFDALNLDARIIRTLVPFITKPGFLTSEFLEGRRKKYTSPLRLYLLMSLLFFFLAQVTSRSFVENQNNAVFNFSNDSTETSLLNDSLAIELLKNDSISFVTIDTSGSKGALRKEAIGERFKQSIIKALTDKNFFVKSLYKNISYILFILMPAFALILKILYIRRKRYYIDHLVFSLNMHSFALLFFSLLLVLKQIFPAVGDGFNLGLILLLIYFTMGMKRFYKQGLFKTIIKEIILGLVYTILLMASMIVVMIATIYYL